MSKYCIVCGKVDELRLYFSNFAEFEDFKDIGICHKHWNENDKILRSLNNLNFELGIFKMCGVIPDIQYFKSFAKGNNLNIEVIDKIYNIREICNISNEILNQESQSLDQNKIISKDYILNLQIELGLNDLSTPEQIEKFFQGV